MIARRAALLLPVLLALSGCSPSAPAEPEPAETEPSAAGVSLVPRFRAGESAVYVHTEITKQSQQSAMHGLTRQIREARRFRIETIEAEPGGVALLLLSMERVQSEVVDNGSPVFEFDSDVPFVPEDGEREKAIARGRRLLAGLVAEIRVGPSGSVLSMSANLSESEVAGLPPRVRPLLAENWFRAVVESLYRPFGDRSELDLDEPWEDSYAAGPPFEGEEHLLVRSSRVAGVVDGRVVLESTTRLHSAGELNPEAYAGLTRQTWLLEEGVLEGYLQTQRVTKETVVAGIPSIEQGEREISLERVNSDLPSDDKEDR